MAWAARKSTGNGVTSRILLTGASGFVGKATAPVLAAGGYEVIAATRNGAGLPPGAFRGVATGDMDHCDWPSVLEEAGPIDFVVHLASRVHRMRENSADPLPAFRLSNRDATLALARAAVEAGVKRFVFVSSVKASVDRTSHQPVDEVSSAMPESPYGISKREAEEGLISLAAQSGLEVVILRPPLIYGPGVKANFRSLVKLVHAGVPIPLGAIDNGRSLIAVGNLASAIATALAAPGISLRAFYVTDGPPLSTAALLRAIGAALGRPARLVPVPVSLLRGLAGLAGQGARFGRLAESLAVDDSAFRRMTGWSPPISMSDELQRLKDDLYP